MPSDAQDRLVIFAFYEFWYLDGVKFELSIYRKANKQITLYKRVCLTRYKQIIKKH